MPHYDLVIIGSGPGGYSAAVRAGQFGLRTAIVEKDPRLGGTCLLVGCIPTKALLHTAEVWTHFKNGVDGITADNPRLNLSKVIDRKNQIVNKHSKGVDFLMKKNKVDVVRGTARLKGAGCVDVQTEKGVQTLETKNVIIATGSEARMLPGLQPDKDRILTNVEILDLREIPKTMIVIGSGAVGSEFASMFQRFGAKVTLIEMLPRIVPVEDEEVSKELERTFKKGGIRVETGARAQDIKKTDKGVELTVTLSNGKTETLAAEKVLIGVGRKPMTDGIGLETTRVETDRGFIKVNQWQQTAEPGVYAIGDVVSGTPQLAHVATKEGMVAVANIAGKPVEPINKLRIPGATYTEPGIGSVGLTEAAARAAGYKVKIGKFGFMPNSMATILGRHEGFVKVVADEKYGEILGVHIIGPQAWELITEGVTAMMSEATVETLMNTVHAHPTLYEAVGEAFNNVYGLAINA
ncbi:MAG TPA: dihydrolipoyl dehydrogenase [Bryobacteraceae bacterium]|nr:dihydrolipoyl dehydrogenase [Bryobacteraceae bacterium]